MFLPTVISALTCSLPVEDQSQKEISIAQGVQATLNAEKVMTLEVQQPQLVIEEHRTNQTSEVSVDSINQTVIADAQNTAQSTNQTPISEAFATATSQAPLSSTESADSLLITDLKMQSFVPLSSGCTSPDKPFWKSVPVADLDEMLISKNSVYIDPNWQKLYLSFWHKSGKRGYDTMFSAEILVRVDGKFVMI